MRLSARLGLIVLLLGASAAQPATAQGDKLKVVATFSILADIAGTIGGDKVAVTMLVGPDSDTHTYQPTPADARAVAAAKLLVTNGLGLEGWLDRLREAAKSSAAVVVASSGIKPLTMEEERDDKAAASGLRKPGARINDPHAWQNLSNGQIYVANIVKALAVSDPANAAFYQQNGAAYTSELAALDGKVKAMLAELPKAKRRVITTHDAFQYYGKAYGVEFIAPLGISTDNEPSAGDVAKLERQIKREKIKALFLENVTNGRLIRQIAKDTGAIVGPSLFSDALSKPEEPASTYVKMFEYNTATLVEGMMRNDLHIPD
jgi:zinc/manganese transport system substrate-binding protein